MIRFLPRSKGIPGYPAWYDSSAAEESKMTILNLTQLQATEDQIEVGICDSKDRQQLLKLLTFDILPTTGDIVQRAQEIAAFAAKETNHGDLVMIGGVPFLMGALERELEYVGRIPVYAFSRRVVEEVQQKDGTVQKKAVFKHVGFVPAVRMQNRFEVRRCQCGSGEPWDTCGEGSPFCE